MNTDVDTAKLIMLSGGRFVTPVAAFLAPVFLLRYTRNTSVKTGMAILFVLLFLSLLVRLHDYLAVPRPLNMLLIAGFAALELVPFFVDRTLREYLPRFLRPLVLPTVFVVLGFVLSPLMPFGSMWEKAYSQSGNSELMQLLAITGTHGLTFVIFWFAATMASLWDAGFVWQRNRSQVMPMMLCVMIVFVIGGFRIIFDKNQSQTVRIAGVVVDQTTLKKSLQGAGVMSDFAGLTGTGVNRELVDSALEAHLQELYLHTEQLASLEASIVVWAEASAVIYGCEAGQFDTAASALARSNNITLVASLLCVIEPQTEVEEAALENKLVVYGPDGQRLGQYVKTKPLWNKNLVQGDGTPLVIDTPHGKLAFMIGFDADFPNLVRQAGDADIAIIPAADWRPLARHHSLMSIFRGVENGFSIFRPAQEGVSLASDSHGRILARVDSSRRGPDNFIADVPTSGMTTPYTTAGEWFGWFASALLFIVLLVALLASRKRKNYPPPDDPTTPEK